MVNKILFVYDLLHPIHKEYMESITEDFIHKSDKIPKDYDVYVVEGSYAKAAILKKKLKDKKVIALIADPRLYYLSNKQRFDFKKNKVVKSNIARISLMKYFLNKIDGAICIGELNYNLFRNFNKNIPVMWADGFIFDDMYKKLEKNIPSFKNNNILFIGHGPDWNCKGIDLLVESFKLLKEENPDAKLYILGRWDVKKEWEVENVFFEGEKNILDYLDNTSLGIHLGRGEAFGANIPEMMLGGVPVITTEFTGAKEAVRKVDKSFVVDIDERKIADKMKDLLEMKLDDKIMLSELCKDVAKEYSQSRQVEMFKGNFNEVFKCLF